MQELAAVRSVKQAVRVIKQMQHQSPEWLPDLHELGRKALRRVLQQHMQRQVRRYLAEAERQGVVDRRNGSYRRHLLTALGDLELCVPRTRRFSALAVVQAYARRERHVDRLILACFALGLSTRKVGEALLTTLGERVSPATVSEVAKLLDQEVAAFHRRRLSGRYRVLVFDGVVLSRRTGAGALRRPVLVALGIRPDGSKEILDFTLAPGESQAAWEQFQTDLERRGLTTEGLELVVTDGGPGLLAALATVFPGVPVQRCWAHKTRNILDKMRDADRERAKRDLHRISHAPDRVRARRAARRFADRWEAGARRHGPPTPSSAASARCAAAPARWACSVTAPRWSASSTPCSPTRTASRELRRSWCCDDPEHPGIRTTPQSGDDAIVDPAASGSAVSRSLPPQGRSPAASEALGTLGPLRP